MSRKYKAGGFYWERELYQSDAFLSLNKNSIKILIALLDNRQRENNSQARTKKGNIRKPQFINLDRLEIPYGMLEKVYKIPRSSIPGAIDELLARGFVTISYHGGTYKHDKSKYAWSDNWGIWKPGTVFSKRPKDTIKRGYQGKKLGATGSTKNKTRAKNRTHTHAKK